MVQISLRIRTTSRRVDQIVIPRVYRPEILNLAYETPMSGHSGVNKTYHKILNHFYWPGKKSDVSQFCKSCHTCQMVGKPNQTIQEIVRP